jgi:nucleoside-diphosphate-sugar epimerase
MHNSALINLNVVDRCQKQNVGKIFYSSSACVYPEYNQTDPNNPKCSEESAYPAAPDSEYGWEKLFSERLYLSYMRNHGMQIKIGRFHNIFGPEGSWNNGKEKVPAAVCRKVAEALDGGEIEMWGDGDQTRSFMYIDECLEAVFRFMQIEFSGPINIGSEEMISINNLAKMVIDISGKKISIKNVPGPTGVRGRKSDNNLFREKVGWDSKAKLKDGIDKTYNWVLGQVRSSN